MFILEKICIKNIGVPILVNLFILSQEFVKFIKNSFLNQAFFLGVKEEF